MTLFTEIEVVPHEGKVTLNVLLVIAGLELPVPALRVQAIGAGKPDKTTTTSGAASLEYPSDVAEASVHIEVPDLQGDDGEIGLLEVNIEKARHRVVFVHVPPEQPPTPPPPDEQPVVLRVEEPIPVFDIRERPAPPKERVVPVLTAARSKGEGAELERRVDQAIEQVFGRRFDANDPNKLLELLEATFTLEDGAVVRRRGLGPADGGSTVGAQARLVAKVTRSLDVIRPLLAELGPLAPRFDDEDGAAAVGMFEIEAEELQAEIGQPGAIDIRRVDRLIGDDRNAGVMFGLYNDIGRRYGIDQANVVTVEDDRICAAYVSIGGELLDVFTAWQLYKQDGKNDLATTIATVTQLSDILTEDIAVLKELFYTIGLDDASLAAMEIDALDPPARLGGYLRRIERAPGTWSRLLDTGGNRGLQAVAADVADVLDVARTVQKFLEGEEWATDDIDDAIAEVVASIERIEGEI